MLPCAIVEGIIAINMKCNVLHTSHKRDNDLLSYLISCRFDLELSAENQKNKWWLRNLNCMIMSIE